MTRHLLAYDFFFFNDTATTEIYTLSLHDALPIYHSPGREGASFLAKYPVSGFFVPAGALMPDGKPHPGAGSGLLIDRKSTRLNSSHANISYAVFCLKKKK